MISAVMVYITVCQICVFVLQLGQFRATFIQFCIKIGQKTDNKKSAEICGNSWLGQACKYREENYEDFLTLLSVVSVLKKQLYLNM